MIRIASIVRSVLVASALSMVALPAMADPGKQHDKKHEKVQFPVAAATYKQGVDARLAKSREHLEKALGNKKIPEAVRKDVRDRADADARKIDAALDRVTKDGTVTKEEAKEVHALAKSRNEQIRAAMKPYKHGKSGKGKKA